ncbi:MAG: aminotransferase class I/II-fold pyridoxal phosphate-dependent enzyme [Pseudomonadota bacterium]
MKLDRPFTGVLNDLQRLLQSKPAYTDIINLGLGNPGTPVDPALLDLVHKDIHQNDGISRYGSSIGDLSTRKTIADFMMKIRKTTYQFDENCNQIAIVGGITETIKEYFLALYNKDTEIDGEIIKHNKLKVLIPIPAYAWYFDALKKIPGVETIKIDTRNTGWKLDAKSLEHFLERKPPPDALILNYPCNPTGQDLTEAQ